MRRLAFWRKLGTDPMILYMTIRESKKLVPFSLFLLKCRCTGRFTTGVVAPTSPVLLPFESTGEVWEMFNQLLPCPAPFIYRGLSHLTGEGD